MKVDMGRFFSKLKKVMSVKSHYSFMLSNSNVEFLKFFTEKYIASYHLLLHSFNNSSAKIKKKVSHITCKTLIFNLWAQLGLNQ